MKRTLFLGFILLLLQFVMSLKANAENMVVYKGTITIYVGEEKTMYHSIPYQYYVTANSWYLRETSGSAWSDGQENCGVKIVSKTSSSCTIKGIWDNEDSFIWCELRCKGTKNSTGEYYECYWKVIVKSHGSIFVDATPAAGVWNNPTMVEAGTKVYLSARTSDGSSASDAQIYYRTDGEYATVNSTPYTSAGITITKKTYLSAIASKSGYDPVTMGGYYDVISDIKVTSITLNKSSLSLETGKSETLTATVKPDNATDKTVTWSSSSTSVATVDSNGKVTAKSKGSATITCKANDGSGKQATCLVTVTDPVVEPTAITISPSSKTITVGEEFYASYTLTPSNATTTVTWSSDDTSIATVTQSGLVKGIKAGYTYINVKTANGKTDWFKITVTDPGPVVESISLWWSTTVHLDGTKKLYPTVTPSDANPKLTWTSSDTSVATVDQNGVVTGKRIGSATISVTTDNGKSDWCNVKVVKVFTAQTVEGKTMTFQILSEDDKTCQAGEDYTIKALGSYQVTTWAVPYGTSGQVTIPSTAGGYTVTGIGGLGFLNLKSITSVSIPNTVTSIGYAAFEGCTGIETMTIPNSVTDISSDAFYKCTKLKAVTLPNSIGRLRDCLFYGDVALTSIDIPSSVTQIGWRTFDGTGLSEITIPASVTKIESYAFANCTNLEKVTSMIANPFEIDKNVFENTADDDTSFTTATLYVPKGTKSAYESTSAWNEFKAIIEMGADPTLKGDVNGDGYVNGTDLVALTNIILGKNEEKASADVNGDGYVNGTDYVALANIILGKANARRMTDAGQASGSAAVYMEPFAISAGETKELDVSLSNPDDALTLLQFDLQLPKGLTMAKNGDDYQANMSGRTNWSSHQLSVYGNDHHARFLLASGSNDLIEGTEGAVVRLTVTADADFKGGAIALYDILGVSPDEQEVNMPDSSLCLVGGVTGIYSINGGQDAPVVYSLSGQRHNGMKKGINIVGGKKVIKK